MFYVRIGSGKKTFFSLYIREINTQKIKTNTEPILFIIYQTELSADCLGFLWNKQMIYIKKNKPHSDHYLSLAYQGVPKYFILHYYNLREDLGRLGRGSVA